MKPLVFPSNDHKRFVADCQELKFIILHGLEPHCALLRALKQDHEDSATNIDATDHQALKTLAQLGPEVAHEKGQVTNEFLRQLARNPVQLELLFEHIFNEDGLDHWLDDSPALSSTFQPEDMMQELVERLRQAARRPQESIADAPIIDTSESTKAAVGYWPPQDSGMKCLVRMPVTSEATLTLKYQDRTWGKMLVKRVNASSYSIVARTGVFLACPPVTTLSVRLAAATSSTVGNANKSQIFLDATTDGILVTIILA